MLNIAVNEYDLYEGAYNRLLNRYQADTEMDARATVKKLLFLGIKKINAKPDKKHFTRQEIEFDFQEIELILACIGLLTPVEFMQIFPIDKDYKGHKWQSKDYFYTRDYIQKLPQNEAIGENVQHFLWEYMNTTISIFIVQLMESINNLRKLDGLPSLAEEWATKNSIKTYTSHTDQKGREFLIDGETSRSIRLKPKRHLHVVGMNKSGTNFSLPN